MKLDINELEAKLIERYGKEGWNKKLNNFYQKYYDKNYERARKTLILRFTRFLDKASPSTYTPPEK